MSGWTVIDHREVGSGGAANIVFNNIPQVYDDLALFLSLRTDGNGEGYIDINNSAANWSSRHLYGSGSGVDTNSNPYAPSQMYVGVNPNASTTSNTFGNKFIYFPNYRLNQNKSVSVDSVSENNATLAYQNLLAGLWSNTTAITSIQIDDRTGGFVQYSSATLYGITKGSSGGVTVS